VIAACAVLVGCTRDPPPLEDAAPAPGDAAGATGLAEVDASADAARDLEEAERARQAEAAASCRIVSLMVPFLRRSGFTACGKLSWRAERGSAPYEATRSCVLAAVKEKRAFAATWESAGFDSFVEDGVAGRPTAAGYELRWYTYDSSVSGRGWGDPSAHTYSCKALEDARRVPAAESSLELSCVEQARVDHCQ
jgi:hypothetical protein